MNIILIILFATGGIAYLIFLFLILTGLSRLCKIEHPPLDDYPSLSVIISARNEEANIAATLESLLAQDYPVDKCQIIIVDDRSTDRTSEIVSSYAEVNPTIKLLCQIDLIPGFSPKKQALEKGITASTSEIIITTDADCHHDPLWLKTLVAPYRQDITGMTIGQARFTYTADAPLWQKMQALDFATQNIAAAGLVSAGKPFNCTGASLSFRRALYDEIGGYSGVNQLASGDDELLLYKAGASRWSVVAVKGKTTVVQTEPPASLRQLWHQRVRWGSKGLHYSSGRKLLLTGVFLFYITLLISPIVLFYNGLFLFAVVWGTKLILDGSVLNFGKKLFRDKFNPVLFFLTEILHPAFIIAVTIAGTFGRFEWKGATYCKGRAG